MQLFRFLCKIKELFIFALLLSDTVYSYGKSWEPDTVGISNAYARLIENPCSKEAQMYFFNVFPSTNIGLKLMYGIFERYRMEDDIWEFGFRPKQYSNLYKQYGHIEAFQDMLYQIEDSLYCRKVVNLSIGERLSLDCSARSLMQDVLRNTMKYRKEWMWKTISGLTPADQLSFWIFYWANNIPCNDYFEECDSLYEEMSAKYPETVKIMRVGSNYSNGKTWFDGPDRFFMRGCWESVGADKMKRKNY